MKDIIDRQLAIEQLPDFEQLYQSDQKFIDPQFKPCFDSIFSRKQTKFVWEDGKYHYKQTKDDYENSVDWIRLSELYPLDQMNLVDNVSPRDVKQGSLGD